MNGHGFESFPQWYTRVTSTYGVSPDVDYQAAYNEGIEPDSTGKWPTRPKAQPAAPQRRDLSRYIKKKPEEEAGPSVMDLATAPFRAVPAIAKDVGEAEGALDVLGRLFLGTGERTGEIAKEAAAGFHEVNPLRLVTGAAKVIQSPEQEAEAARNLEFVEGLVGGIAADPTMLIPLGLVKKAGSAVIAGTKAGKATRAAKTAEAAGRLPFEQVQELERAGLLPGREAPQRVINIDEPITVHVDDTPTLKVTPRDIATGKVTREALEEGLMPSFETLPKGPTTEYGRLISTRRAQPGEFRFSRDVAQSKALADEALATPSGPSRQVGIDLLSGRFTEEDAARLIASGRVAPRAQAAYKNYLRAKSVADVLVHPANAVPEALAKADLSSPWRLLKGETGAVRVPGQAERTEAYGLVRKWADNHWQLLRFFSPQFMYSNKQLVKNILEADRQANIQIQEHLATHKMVPQEALDFAHNTTRQARKAFNGSVRAEIDRLIDAGQPGQADAVERWFFGRPQKTKAGQGKKRVDWDKKSEQATSLMYDAVLGGAPDSFLTQFGQLGVLLVQHPSGLAKALMEYLPTPGNIRKVENLSFQRGLIQSFDPALTGHAWENVVMTDAARLFGRSLKEGDLKGLYNATRKGLRSPITTAEAILRGYTYLARVSDTAQKSGHSIKTLMSRIDELPKLDREAAEFASDVNLDYSYLGRPTAFRGAGGRVVGFLARYPVGMAEKMLTFGKDDFLRIAETAPETFADVPASVLKGMKAGLVDSRLARLMYLTGILNGPDAATMGLVENEQMGGFRGIAEPMGISTATKFGPFAFFGDPGRTLTEGTFTMQVFKDLLTDLGAGETGRAVKGATRTFIPLGRTLTRGLQSAREKKVGVPLVTAELTGPFGMGGVESKLPEVVKEAYDKNNPAKTEFIDIKLKAKGLPSVEELAEKAKVGTGEQWTYMLGFGPASRARLLDAQGVIKKAQDEYANATDEALDTMQTMYSQGMPYGVVKAFEKKAEKELQERFGLEHRVSLTKAQRQRRKRRAATR